jgi:hypothetical protein
MQDIVYHHLPMSGEKNTTKSGERTKPPHRKLLYCILPKEYRIVPARSSTAAGFLRQDQDIP